MLVHQCSSCKALGTNITFAIDALPTLPQGWGRIMLTLPNEHTHRYYDLCVECLAMPITFGNITLNARVQ
jgi:hypothetical protein